VIPSERGLCDIALLGIPFPHPSLINSALRRGLSRDVKMQLYFFHELGHVQALPFAAAYWLLASRASGRRRTPFLLTLLALQAFWEVAAESYVIWRMGRHYLTAWRKSPNPALVLFWPLMILLASLPFFAGTGRESRREQLYRNK